MLQTTTIKFHNEYIIRVGVVTLNYFFTFHRGQSIVEETRGNSNTVQTFQYKPYECLSKSLCGLALYADRLRPVSAFPMMSVDETPPTVRLSAVHEDEIWRRSGKMLVSQARHMCQGEAAGITGKP